MTHLHVDPTEARELQCVGQQVADDLAHPGRVADYLRRELRVDQARQFDTGGRVLGKQVGGILHQGAEIERNAFEFQLAGVEFRQVEDVVEQFDQYLARVMGNR
ncbi:hypothetical protein D3C80_1530520 [compost metagenome]